jgi:hypothetical protein
LFFHSSSLSGSLLKLISFLIYLGSLKSHNKLLFCYILIYFLRFIFVDIFHFLYISIAEVFFFLTLLSFTFKSFHLAQ